MKQVDSIDVAELTEMAKKMYEEQFLLEQGSKQNDLWGVNLHPANFGQEDFIEFDSMINIRPRQQNMSRSVDDPEIQQKIIKLVLEKVKP